MKTLKRLLLANLLKNIFASPYIRQEDTSIQDETSNISKKAILNIEANGEKLSSGKDNRDTCQIVKKPVIKYFAVDAKVGHVGKNKYLIKTFIVYAENGKAAAEFVRNSPRVKHDHKDAIRNVTEISLQEYTERRRAMYEDPYFNVTSIQEQRAANIDIENAFEEEVELSFKNHKHSLRKTFHEDERYLAYRNYLGKINFEDIA